jgi:hypothetical protein
MYSINQIFHEDTCSHERNTQRTDVIESELSLSKTFNMHSTEFIKEKPICNVIPCGAFHCLTEDFSSDHINRSEKDQGPSAIQ